MVDYLTVGVLLSGVGGMLYIAWIFGRSASKHR